MNASDPRMAAAHRLLVDSVRRLATSTDWRTVLDLARQLPQYSPNNCLLLAAQGAHGMVMGYRAWQRIPAAGGGRCQVRRGATSLAVLAPITRTPSEPDPAGGDGTAVRRVVGYRRAAVFDQRALIAPPAVPDVTPRPLTAAAPEQLRHAVDGLITGSGYRLLPAEQATRIAPSNGLTDFAARTVAVRADLPAAQQLKTAVHELAHIRLHTPHPAAEPMERGRAEVEAESVAYLVTAELGLDASAHTLPYLTGWSGGDPDLVLATAQRVITAARGIADDLTLQLRTPAPPAPPPPVDPPPPAGEGLVLADAMPTTEPAGSPPPGGNVVLGSRSGWWQIGWDPTHTTFHAQHHPTRAAGPGQHPAGSVRIGGAPAAVLTVGALEERLGFALPGAAREHLDADRRARPGWASRPWRLLPDSEPADPPPPDTWPRAGSSLAVPGQPDSTYWRALRDHPPLRTWEQDGYRVEILATTPITDSDLAHGRQAVTYRLSHHERVVFSGDDIGAPPDVDPAGDQTVRAVVDLLCYADPEHLTPAQAEFTAAHTEDLSGLLVQPEHPYPPGTRIDVHPPDQTRCTGAITETVTSPDGAVAYLWRPDVADLPGHPWRTHPGMAIATPQHQVAATLAAPDTGLADWTPHSPLGYASQVEFLDDHGELATGYILRVHARDTGELVYRVQPDRARSRPVDLGTVDLHPIRGTAWPSVHDLVAHRDADGVPLRVGELLAAGGDRAVVIDSPAGPTLNRHAVEPPEPAPSPTPAFEL